MSSERRIGRRSVASLPLHERLNEFRQLPFDSPVQEAPVVGPQSRAADVAGPPTRSGISPGPTSLTRLRCPVLRSIRRPLGADARSGAPVTATQPGPCRRRSRFGREGSDILANPHTIARADPFANPHTIARADPFADTHAFTGADALANPHTLAGSNAVARADSLADSAFGPMPPSPPVGCDRKAAGSPSLPPSPRPTAPASPPAASRIRGAPRLPAPAAGTAPTSAAGRPEAQRRPPKACSSRSRGRLSVETAGPRRILVGKESTYEVTLRNAGQVAAENVVVSVELPEWADVTGAEATAGSTNAGKSPASAGPLRWTVGRVEPKDSPRLSLRVVPRQSRPFELGVKFDFTPAASQAQIEVQEPKLAIGFQGPRGVLWARRRSSSSKWPTPAPATPRTW